MMKPRSSVATPAAAKPQVVGVRHPSDREQQVRTGDFPAALGTIQLYDDSRAALLHDHALGTGFDDHAFRCAGCPSRLVTRRDLPRAMIRGIFSGRS
jgi:hypothetical protein